MPDPFFMPIKFYSSTYTFTFLILAKIIYIYLPISENSAWHRPYLYNIN